MTKGGGDVTVFYFFFFMNLIYLRDKKLNYITQVRLFEIHLLNSIIVILHRVYNEQNNAFFT